ncbi:hypothetical protein C5167_025081 [Papaver somniferum]|uniref:SUZ domain-containing protein n=1 Tax=Papaver somniferum TaxID=3469 RepID=A0A4Y7JU83_PAPSO|nr:hypothetical protein C5167_025081 [Papaver somniferum]
MAKRKYVELKELEIDIMTEIQEMKKELKSELSKEIKKGFEELKEWLTLTCSGHVPNLDEEKSTLQSTSKTNTVSTKSSLEEREAAYLAARQRIFSKDDSEVKELVTPKPRNIPVVARRMIAHALGQRVSSSSAGVTPSTRNEPNQKNQELSGSEKSVGHQNLNLRNSRETAAVSIQELSSQDRKIVDKSQVTHAATSERKIQKKPAGSDNSVNCVPPLNGRMRQAPSDDNLKQEHLGAAKRMFAHALRSNGTKELNGLIMKTDTAMPIEKD